MNLSKNNKFNILILGGGISSERFIESLMFNNNYFLTVAGFEKLNKSKKLAEKYDLKYIFFYDIMDFNKYDIIILAIPPSCKYETIKYITDKNYKNKFIIEKPFSMTIKECKSILNLIEKNDFIIPYTRSYLKDTYAFNYKDDTLIWNIPNNNTLDIYKENLPHIIQLLIDNKFCFNDISIIKKTKNKLKLKLTNSYITIQFKNNNGIYILNDNEYKINYRLSNNQMILYLLSENYDRIKEIRNLKLNIEIFEKIY